MNIAIDMDNTIMQCPVFFRVLTQALAGQHAIHILTNRDPTRRAETVQELADFGIHYDHLRITAEKAVYIIDRGIEVFFEDTDEYFLELPESVAVFKMREPGNFNFQTQRWIYGDRTGERIGKGKA